MKLDIDKIKKVLEEVIENYEEIRTDNIDCFTLQPVRNLLVDVKDFEGFYYPLNTIDVTDSKGVEKIKLPYDSTKIWIEAEFNVDVTSLDIQGSMVECKPRNLFLIKDTDGLGPYEDLAINIQNLTGLEVVKINLGKVVITKCGRNR